MDWDAILTLSNLGWLLAGILGILATAVSAKFTQILTEAQEAIEAYVHAKEDEGPGGSTLTTEEKAHIYQEALDVIREIIETFTGGLTETIGKLALKAFRKLKFWK